jgi:hypothetical protein
MAKVDHLTRDKYCDIVGAIKKSIQGLSTGVLIIIDLASMGSLKDAPINMKEQASKQEQ